MTRITLQEALELWQELDLFAIGDRAHRMRLAMHPDPVVTYIVDRNINYTNICICACNFCAFFRPPGHPEGYVLSFAELGRKIEETVSLGGYQILLQGGLNPELNITFYKSMLGFIKENFPTVAAHALSPPEIAYLSDISGMETQEVIKQLKEAGLTSIPGGGAEILGDAFRNKNCPQKCSASAWLNIMREAHLEGLKSTATMMFGAGESLAERLEHLEKIRNLQDETKGFTAFIPWTFQPQNTRLRIAEASSVEYLKFLALCRLFLDNIPNIQASWVTQGPQTGQLSLFFGANDLGSTMIEENVVAAAEVKHSLPEARLRRLIENSGFVPMRRNMDYSFRP